MRKPMLLLCALAAALLIGCTAANDPIFIVTVSSAPSSAAPVESVPSVPAENLYKPQGPLQLTQHPSYVNCTLSEAGYIDRDGVFHFCPAFRRMLPQNGEVAYPLLEDGTEPLVSHWIGRDYVAAQQADGTFCGVSRMKSATRFLDGLFTYGDLGKDILARLAAWSPVVQVYPLANASTGGLYFAAQTSDGGLRTVTLNTLYLPKKARWVEQLESSIDERFVSSILPYKADAPLVLFTDGTAWCADTLLRDKMKDWTDLVQVAAITGRDGRDGVIGLRADGTLYNDSSFPISETYCNNITRIFTGAGACQTPMLVLQRVDGAVFDVRLQQLLGVFMPMDQIISVDGWLFGVTERGYVVQLRSGKPDPGSFADEWSQWARTVCGVRTVAGDYDAESESESSSYSEPDL